MNHFSPYRHPQCHPHTSHTFILLNLHTMRCFETYQQHFDGLHDDGSYRAWVGWLHISVAICSHMNNYHCTDIPNLALILSTHAFLESIMRCVRRHWQHFYGFIVVVTVPERSGLFWNMHISTAICLDMNSYYCTDNPNVALQTFHTYSF